MSNLKRKESQTIDSRPSILSSATQLSKSRKKVRIGGSTVLGGLDDESSTTHLHTMNPIRPGIKGVSDTILRKSQHNITRSGWAATSGCDMDDDDMDEELESFKHRRGAVRSDAYESDEDVVDSDDNTDDDGDGTKAAPGFSKFGKPKHWHNADDEEGDDKNDQKPEADHEDDDMFGEGFDKKNPTSIPKKHLESNEINGQEWREDFDDIIDDNGTVKIEPFNMDRELDEGEFDESGHYVVKKDEHAIHDSWLQNLSKMDIEKARRAKEAQMDKNKEVEDVVFDSDINMLWREVLGYMQPRETLIKTIQRIGFLSKKKKAKDVKKSDADIESRLTPDMIKQRKVALERITALGSHLFDSDQSAYEKSYEQIVRLLRSKDLIDDDWVHGTPLPPLSEKAQSEAFEYKWGETGTDLYGPFTHNQMNVWAQCGLLAQGDAQVRIVGSDSIFKPVSEFTFQSTTEET
ncbi:hypothetical protein BATDEDRAFT_35734 [Batrachochytrium dendrobatidis JAM81]|uniref:GYF domain-containing protein n=1 Tax=Batrachochytrium dendrobatidis (strain JAM81 / FGSC 10211) TaxID=684364 RepID=F4P8Z7_BATDJ|nr:uncharacterized protein BATDEDRAFT_35734 [Batrachochytrium dendrobatidis JAM81]EGF78256.1 hypothetical protein BATDEDRAFT_35734 [Batrachochytrium dendrobatidis JAM81]|eukprot:XP_006681138.1 hypothetical protein BATDEDRAFT_35734 [Batrachochytrium dendrobatidis JAM81]